MARGSTPNGSTSSALNHGQDTVIQNTPGAGALPRDPIEYSSQESRNIQYNRETERDGERLQSTKNFNDNNKAVFNGSLGAIPRTQPGDGQYVGDLPQHILDQINEFRSRNQAINSPTNRPSGNIQISQLRENSELRRQVEVGVTSLREQIPSLSAAPNAPSLQQPQYINQEGATHSVSYDWVVDSRGQRHLIQLPSQSAPVVAAGGNDSRSIRYVCPKQTNQANQQSQHQSNELGQQSPARIIEDRRQQAQYSVEFRCSPRTGRIWQVQVPVTNDRFPEPASPKTYRREFRCSPTTGRTWQVEVPVIPDNSPQQDIHHYEWRIDPHTGERFQIMVSSRQSRSSNSYVHGTRNNNVAQNHQTAKSDLTQAQGFPNNYIVRDGNRQQYETRFSHQQPFSQPVRQNEPLIRDTTLHAPTIFPDPNVTGITRIEQGKGKKNSCVVDMARNCPAKWSKSATNSSINLPLYAWGAVAQLEACMSGRSNRVSEGEILGKLRHLKCILEVCCLNSTSTDFAHYGWQIAKDYALKVEDEIGQGLTSWEELTSGVRTGSLLLAQMDCPRQMSSKQVTNKKEANKEVICTTFNRCLTKNKCEYELSNPDRSCQRKHECSWCRNNLNQGNRHQAWDCRKKEASASNSTNNSNAAGNG